IIEFHKRAFSEPETAATGIADVFRASGYTAERFQPYRPLHTDKDRHFFRLEWERSMLGPFDTANLSEWEHFLFTFSK
ncbi:MAG TPA: hypothetical protein VLM40_11145, partial [Gemmata sp.]|nr:hypothetical protein [Gemmata sp.]